MTRENPSWSPTQYLKFERERTIPCRDLVNRIELDSPSSVVDLGCGPGNSTAVLLERWPNAEVLGLDSSAEMLENARRSPLRATWLQTDITGWQPGRRFQLLFSNAVFQWIPDHRMQVPRLFDMVSEGGALAVQIPSGRGPWVEAVRETANSPAWKSRLPESVLNLGTEELPFYYDLLCSTADRIDLWETEYVHVLPSPESVLEWTRGSALRPLLDRLPDDGLRRSFVSDYTARIVERYPAHPDGKVLFPFLRRFWIAYR